MDDNIKALVDRIEDLSNVNGVMFAQIQMLHSVVDSEDIRCAEHGYTPDIKTEYIRDIFGWDECAQAVKARNDRNKVETNE